MRDYAPHHSDEEFTRRTFKKKKKGNSFFPLILLRFLYDFALNKRLYTLTVSERVTFDICHRLNTMEAQEDRLILLSGTRSLSSFNVVAHL